MIDNNLDRYKLSEGPAYPEQHQCEFCGCDYELCPDSNEFLCGSCNTNWGILSLWLMSNELEESNLDYKVEADGSDSYIECCDIYIGLSEKYKNRLELEFQNSEIKFDGLQPVEAATVVRCYSYQFWGR